MHWVEDRATYPIQREVLAFFLDAAHAQNKIVNLHTKGAEAEILELLERHRVERAIVHWYSGPLDIADALAARGALFSIGVELHTSALIQELARKLPLELLLSETDNPGQRGVVHRQAGDACGAAPRGRGARAAARDGPRRAARDDPRKLPADDRGRPAYGWRAGADL